MSRFAIAGAVLLMATNAFAADPASGGPPDVKPVVEILIRALSDKKADLRWGAAVALGGLGPRAADAVDPLRAAFEDENENVRRAAVEALGKIGAPAVPKLLESLQSGKPAVRLLAVEALGRVGADARSAAPELMRILADDRGDADLRAASAAALVGLDPGAESTEIVEQVCKVIRSAGAVPKVRVAAIEAAGGWNVGDDRSTEALLHALADALNSDDVGVVTAAAEALGFVSHKAAFFGPQATAEAAVPLLVQAFKKWNDDRKLRQAVVRALGDIQTDSPEALPLLIAALTDGDADVRRDAAYALQAFGPTAAAAVPVLSHMVRSEEAPASRGVVARTLGAIAPDDPEAVSALLEVLKSDLDNDVRLSALFALKPGDPNNRLRSVPVLRRIVLDDTSKPLRVQAAAALGGFGASAAEAVPELLAALKAEDPQLRKASAVALGQVGASPTRAVPPLTNLLRNDPDDDVRQGAAQALGLLGAFAPEDVVPALLDAAKVGSSRMQIASIQALGQIGPAAARDAVPALLPLLSDRTDPDVARSVIETFVKMGPAVRIAFPRLAEMLQGANDSDRWAAAAAVGKIAAGLDDGDPSPKVDLIPDLQKILKNLQNFRNALNLTEQQKELDELAVRPLQKTLDALQKYKEEKDAERFRDEAAATTLVVAAALPVLWVGWRTREWWSWLLIPGWKRRRGQRVEWELDFARNWAATLLPAKGAFVAPGVAIAHRLRPASTIAGDFYQFLRMDEGRVGITVVDVEGHGFAAASQAIMMYQALEEKVWGRQGDAREQLLEADRRAEANPVLRQLRAHFCMNFLVIDPQRRIIQHANAGMPFPVLFRRNGGEPVVFQARGLYVGGGYTQYPGEPAQDEHPYQDGDLLVVMSDGILEAAEGRSGPFGRDGLLRIVSGMINESPEKIADAVLAAIDRHAPRPGGPKDDQTLIVVRLGEQ